MSKPGQLIQYKGNLLLRFCPINNLGKIDNNLDWNNKVPVDKHVNSVLMFIEPFDYSEETATAAPTPMGPPATATTGTATLRAMAMARKEFFETGKVCGGVFLTGSGKRVWISQYDLEEITKCQKS